MRAFSQTIVLLAVAGFVSVSAQTPVPAAVTYDVVSIRPNTATGPIGLNQRPDGGLVAVSVPLATFIARAYPTIAGEIVGLPDWARTARWDVTATSSRPNVTAEDRAAMLRAMLADRFKLVAHLEKRPRDVYELVPARTDGRLGPGLKKIDVDCTAIRAARQAALEKGERPTPLPTKSLPPLTPGGPSRVVADGPAPPCTVNQIGDDVAGQGTISDLGIIFRFATGREIVDRSDLTGFYQITMRFDQAGARRPPEFVPPPDAAPSVFTAVQEQLGLKFVGATVERDTLVIDRLERPTEN